MQGIRQKTVSLLALGLLLASGCATTSVTPSESANDAPVSAENVAHRAQLVRIGMHKPQIIEWLGEPKSSVPASNANGMRETWTYEIEHRPNYKTIAAVTELVAYVDPITGVLRWIEEPVYNQQRIQRKETIQLTFRGPRLIDIERSVDRVASYRD